jgi:transcription elongation factor Elf1
VGGAAMFTCLNCDEKFYEPDRATVWDAYDAYGYVSVSYFECESCPSCGSENIDEYEKECEEIDE